MRRRLPRPASSSSPSSRSTFWIGAALGLFVGWLCSARPREIRSLGERMPNPAPETVPPPAEPVTRQALPSAVLLASVAGEEDPGAAVDAPAPPHTTRSP